MAENRMMDGGMVVEKRPVDIEDLLRWAYGQTVYVSYRNASDRSLAFNHEYTAIPKGCHQLFAGGELAVLVARDGAADAQTVIAAVNSLDPWSRAIVTRCAKGQTRPDWMEGVEPVEVVVKSYPKKRGRKGKKQKSHVPVYTKRWEPCSPQAICAAREIYARWHTVVGRLAATLAGQLTHWSITGFSAPERPWEESQQKAA